MIHSRRDVYRTDRVTLGGVLYESEPVLIGQVVVATPNSGGVAYARLQFDSGESYKWSGDVADVDDNVETDPELEPRWVRE